MSDKSQIEKLSFEAWWNKKGFNSVILRVAAWEAWMARAKLEETQPVNQPDPDEWIVQDRVPPRKDLDQICWGGGDWHSSWHKEWQFGNMMHGDYPRFGGQLNVRCRRRDLPPVEKAEQWPKYYRPVHQATSLMDQKTVAYFRRETRTSGITVHTDGTTFEFNDWEGDLVPIVQITEAEAMALLKKPEPQPAKTRVRLFRSVVDGLVIAENECPDSDWQEIHHDSKGFYIEE